MARDIDLVIELSPIQIPQLVALLQVYYYVDEQEVLNAVQENKKFALIDLDTLLVVDIFVPYLDLFEKQIKNRARRQILDEMTHPLLLSSAEDIILMKLFCYKTDKIFPDDQWNDILGVLKVQGTILDLTYLEKWATYLHITNLLALACSDSGIK